MRALKNVATDDPRQLYLSLTIGVVVKVAHAVSWRTFVLIWCKLQGIQLRGMAFVALP